MSLLKKKKRHFLGPSFVVSSIENTTCKILSELTLSIEIHLRDQNTDLKSTFQVSTDMLACQRLSIEWKNQNQKQLFRPITTGTNSAMNQSHFLAITCNSLEAREKSRVHGAIGFGFASHWLKNWRDS